MDRKEIIERMKSFLDSLPTDLGYFNSYHLIGIKEGIKELEKDPLEELREELANLGREKGWHEAYFLLRDSGESGIKSIPYEDALDDDVYAFFENLEELRKYLKEVQE